MKIRYSSNNSGGHWWLDDDDWKALEAAGWTVKWKKNDPYYIGPNARALFPLDDEGRSLGALATEATVERDSLGEAIAEWERITGENADDDGCPCCGPPHYFSEED